MEEEGIGLVLARATELRLKISNCIHKATTSASNGPEQDGGDKGEDEGDEGEAGEEEMERLLNICDALESLETQLSSLQVPTAKLLFSWLGFFCENPNFAALSFGKCSDFGTNMCFMIVFPSMCEMEFEDFLSFVLVLILLLTSLPVVFLDGTGFGLREDYEKPINCSLLFSFLLFITKM